MREGKGSAPIMWKRGGGLDHRNCCQTHAAFEPHGTSRAVQGRNGSASSLPQIRSLRPSLALQIRTLVSKPFLVQKLWSRRAAQTLACCPKAYLRSSHENRSIEANALRLLQVDLRTSVLPLTAQFRGQQPGYGTFPRSHWELSRPSHLCSSAVGLLVDKTWGVTISQR